MKLLPRKEVIQKQLKIGFFPLCLAVLYALFSYFNAEESSRSISTAINYFAGSFFFLMWLVGQYLRTEKQIDDSANYQDIQANINEVKESIESLRSSQNPVTDEPQSLNPMLQAAERAVQDGHVLAGLLQAGVAFEQAVIEKVNRHGLYHGKRIPTYRAIKSLGEVMPSSTVADLLGMWKLRNQLVHLSPDAAKEMESQPDLLNSFSWAIGELEK